MKIITKLGLVLSFCAMLARAGETNLVAQLEPLRPFVGKSWKGEFANSTPEKPVHDISRWERVLNGKGIKIVHSVNDGMYGGETMVTWNEKSQKVEYYYFTTAGFTTKGTMAFEGGKVVCHEEVSGSANGVTEVKAVVEMVEGKKMKMASQHLRNGTWEKGHEVIYVETPEAKVVFK